MKIKRILCSLIVILLIPVILCSCGDEGGNGGRRKPKPEDTIRKLEKAFNSYDMEMMLECYEPSVQAMYEGVLELGGAFLGGIDLKTIMQGLGGFTHLYGDSMIEGGLPKIEITINSMEKVTKEKYLADLTIHYIYSSELKKNLPEDTPTEEQMSAYVIKIDGKWYISAENPNAQQSGGYGFGGFGF